jgi:hypothetical protein
MKMYIPILEEVEKIIDKIKFGKNNEKILVKELLDNIYKLDTQEKIRIETEMQINLNKINNTKYMVCKRCGRCYNYPVKICADCKGDAFISLSE